MPTADAALLPPPMPSAEPRGSVRRLDEVGVEAVLGAMIEQKKRSSQPSFAAHETGIELPEDDADRGRVPTRSEVFLKAR